jgi:hypothetical protein
MDGYYVPSDTEMHTYRLARRLDRPSAIARLSPLDGGQSDAFVTRQSWHAEQARITGARPRTGAR